MKQTTKQKQHFDFLCDCLTYRWPGMKITLGQDDNDDRWEVAISGDGLTGKLVLFNKPEELNKWMEGVLTGATFATEKPPKPLTTSTFCDILKEEEQK